MPVIVHSRIWQGSNTATTGGTITLTVAAVTADPVLGKLFNFRDFYANGSTNVPLYMFDKTTGIYEYSRGTLTYGASATLDTISSRVIDISSNGIGTPVAWGAGTRNCIAAAAPEIHLLSPNLGSEIGLGTAAFLNVGTAVNNIVQLITGPKLPAIDGSLLTNLPAGTPSIPSGTVLTGFYQNSAPSGWTKLTTLNDMLIGLTTGTGINPNGGTTSGGSWDNSTGLTIGSHTLTISEIPTHTHPGNIGANFLMSVGSLGSMQSPAGGTTATTASTTGSTGGGGGHDHPITSNSSYRPPTAYTIMCSKN